MASSWWLLALSGCVVLWAVAVIAPDGDLLYVSMEEEEGVHFGRMRVTGVLECRDLPMRLIKAFRGFIDHFSI